MSRLADLENQLVSRLATATLSNSPLFVTVQGVSGGYRPAIREALQRERMPTAMVAFIEETINPETKQSSRGAKFVVLLAARSLRMESNPRHGDDDAIGAMTLLEQARQELDGFEPTTGYRLVGLHEKFIEANDRIAVYELAYRVSPIIEAPLEFGGTPLAGAESRLTLELGVLEMAQPAFGLEARRPGFQELSGLAPREIMWQGQLRAASHAALNTIENNIKSELAMQKPNSITDGTGRVFANTILEQLTHKGPRQETENGETITQEVELQFLQLTPN